MLFVPSKREELMGDFTKISFYIFVLSVAFAVAQNNSHGDLKLGCTSCHTTTGWDSVRFDHAQTSSVLSGRHKNVDRAYCHVIDNFSDTWTECVGCHTDYHQGRLTPQCANCHSEVSWGLFNPVKAHSNTSFQLLGKHSSLDCGSCHFREIEGEFLRLTSDCIACHIMEFQNTANPKHTNLGFGTRCEDCHSFFDWQPALLRATIVLFLFSPGNIKASGTSVQTAILCPLII